LTSISNKNHLFIFFLISLFITLNCAEIVSPPGGEIDKTGPFLINSYPSNQEVNVTVGNTIELTFSEKLKELQLGKGIFISPRQKAEPEIKLKSDKLTIILPDNFLDNQTYVISLSSDIKDLRNNSLDSTNIIAFSTGTKIDSNFLSGFVYDDIKPLPDILVGLYEGTDFSSNINYDSISPLYLSQTDKNGKFDFQYISDKKYQLIAFDDSNKNKFFNSNRERFAVSDRPINFNSEDRLDRLALNLTRISPVELDILSIGLSRDNLVRVSLSNEIDSYIYQNSKNYFTLTNTNDTSIVLSGEGIIKSEKQFISELTFYVPNLSNGSYNAQLFYSDKYKPATFDSLEISIFEDKISPTIKLVEPIETLVEPDELNPIINFTEPIDTSLVTTETFSLWDSDGNKIETDVSWNNLLTASIKASNVNDGSKYVLNITEFEISDLSGNVFGDSLREYNFNTIDNDSLGSISGRIDIKVLSKSKDKVILELFAISTQKIYYLPVNDGIFNLQLPSGKYFMKGHVDSNNNEISDKGMVNPYIFSETINIYPDTIRVRARFETSDINFVIE
jgi:hypothetical protein